MVTLQLKNMQLPPFDTIEMRKRLYDRVADLPWVNVEDRLNGLPSFPLSALAIGDNLPQFLMILDNAVDQLADIEGAAARELADGAQAGGTAD